MAQIIDINFRAVRTSDEFELVDPATLAARIDSGSPPGPGATRVLTPPAYYSLAEGIAGNRRINDALIAAASARPGWRALGVAEPKYGEAASTELERLAALGAAGVVWSARAQGLFANDHVLAGMCRHAAGCGLLSMVRSAPYSINEGLWRVWALAAQVPDIPLVVLGALESWENIQFVREYRGGGDNLFYDLSNLSEAWDLDALVGSMGAERLLFGSGGGDLFAATLAMVDRSTIAATAKQAILAGNAAQLLGRGPGI